jgi:hypothetical protein
VWVNRAHVRIRANATIYGDEYVAMAAADVVIIYGDHDIPRAKLGRVDLDSH